MVKLRCNIRKPKEKADCIETAISPQPQQTAPPPTVMLYSPPSSQQQQQCHQASPCQKRSVAVDACSVGIVTEPECLGPCEPGTSVGLEGIVWKETDNGLLVVNVTWRGKTYVGTLMDATRYAWAPPRPSGCESPVSDFESRTPKGRGKRNCRNANQMNERLPEGRKLRKGRRGTVNSASSNFTAPPSPAKSDISSFSAKRKARPNEVDCEKPKRSRSCSRGVTGAESPTPDGYIVCPEPNCHKKYKHMNGLRYHRTHAHRKNSANEDTRDEDEEDEDEEMKMDKKEKATTVSERAERMKAKERQKIKEQQRCDRDSKDSIDDDIPLKEIANKGNSKADPVPVAGVCKEKQEEESSSSGNIGSSLHSSVSCASSITPKPEPQVVLTKTNVSSQKDCPSPSVSNGTAKKKIPNAPSTPSDVASPQPVSTPTSSVPSLPTSEISAPAAVNIASTTAHGVSLMTTIKSPITSQVFQISPTGNLAGVAIVTQANTMVSLVTAQTLPLMTTATSLSSTCATLANTVTTSILAMSISGDRQNSNKSSSFLPKTVNSARPIVPALSHSHSTSISTASSMQTHNTSLKPIQPKPTIMGDYSTPSPALSDLNSGKHKKSKKKKDSPICPSGSKSHDKLLSSRDNPANDNFSHDDQYKCERSSVLVTSNPSKPYEASSPSLDMSKSVSSPFQPSQDSPKLQRLNSESPMSSGTRLAIPPSTLSLAPVDLKSTINDDVHSPAYSDISDANDSNSPPQEDSPKKDSKKDVQMNGPASHLGSNAGNVQQHFGNIFYYGGPQNFLPHNLSPQMSSPKGIKKENPDDRQAESADKKEASHSMQEEELQQQQKFNYYYPQIQSFINPYNSPALDPHYSLMMQQNPAFRQQYDEYKRIIHHQQQQQQDASNGTEDNLGKQSNVGNPPNRPQGFDFSRKQTFSPNISGTDSTGGGERRHGDERDQALRDKQTENLQILKENIELKSQMGQHQDPYQLYKQQQQQQQQQQNDLRAQMYQKQKLLENNRQDKRKVPPELTSNSRMSPGQSPGQSGSSLSSRLQQDNKPMELLTHDMIKKEVVQPKDHHRSDPVSTDSNRRYDVKEESRPPSSHDKSRPGLSGTPNIPTGGSSTSAPTSSSANSSISMQAQIPSSIPVSLVTSMAQQPIAGAGYSYPYYAPFRPLPLDPTHPMFRPHHHIIGYTAAPNAFIPPSPLGFRVETEKIMSAKCGASPDPENLKVGGGDSATVPAGYSSSTPVHKIHELQEKGLGRPGPGVHSPAPTRSGGSDALTTSRSSSPGHPVDKVKDKQREYSSSPPTQRHVHTHHHTHVVGGFPPLYPPDPYAAMFGHAAAAGIQTASPLSFPPTAPPPPSAPK
ncbi:zinc finger protein 608-like isoform X3 [Biomphalaria glabrata]|uniref:Zinc finger protein 608-like isoform X3 n=1 Tax=Biomphalaria glabrata TaxID=6526 RepID=A0A9W2Z425_BIOGL|nr:zinc finger protein 608-like isoform X3 [Biomphalaria glabrata]